MSPIALNKTMAVSTPDTRQLHQERGLACPGFDGALALQFLVGLGDERFERIQHSELVPQAEVLAGRQAQRRPPSLVGRAVGLRARRNQIVPLQQALSPIVDTGPLADQALAMTHKGPQFPHVARWDPHGRNQSGSHQSR